MTRLTRQGNDSTSLICLFPAGRAKTDQGIPVISLPGQARHTLSWESPRLAHTALSISSI